jgi:hypothetical protein
VRLGTSLLLALAGCGRLGFGPTDDGAAVDAAPADATAATSYPAAVLADGPRAYYRLGESAGEIAADASGNGFDAGYQQVGTGTLSFGQPGAINGDADAAAYMEGEGNAGDGSRANVWLPIEAYPLTGDFTIELWVRTSGIAPDGWRTCFFVWEQHMVAGFRLGMNVERQLELWSWEGGLPNTAETSLITLATVPDQTWTHVALTYDGAAHLYLDGALVLEAPFQFNPVAPDNERGFGAFHGMPSQAAFDEVALYERALSAAELAAHVAVARN